MKPNTKLVIFVGLPAQADQSTNNLVINLFLMRLSIEAIIDKYLDKYFWAPCWHLDSDYDHARARCCGDCGGDLKQHKNAREALSQREALEYLNKKIALNLTIHADLFKLSKII